jgi:TonB family protein
LEPPAPPDGWFEKRNAIPPEATVLEFHAAMEEAATSYRKALEQDGNNEELRWNLAAALEWVGQLEEAAKLYSDPDYPGTDPGLADALRMEVDPAKFRKPVKLQDVRPVYPEPAQRARVQGAVVLETVIDTAGNIASVKVVEPLPGCTAAAIRAARQWKFSPAMVEDEPIPVYLTSTVDFMLTTRGRHAQP